VTLGEPPTRLQRVAAATVRPWVLLVFGPVIVFLLFEVADAVEWVVDNARHERVAELHPAVGVLLSGSVFASLFLFGVLAWSLLGLRADARRTLQAALACKPPTLDGGPARCRECGADLTVPKDAFGVQCRFCAAENLLMLPKRWVERARNVQSGLRLGARDAERAKRLARLAVRRGMAWRAPILLGLLAFLLVRAVANARTTNASWESFLVNEHIDGFGVRLGVTDGSAGGRSIPQCDFGLAMGKLYGRSTFTLGTAGNCGTKTLYCGELIPLRRGDTLRVLWQSQPNAGKIRIGRAHFFGGWTGSDNWEASSATWQALDTSTGDGGVAAEFHADMTGFEVIEFDNADGVTFQTCYLPSTSSRGTTPICPAGTSWDAKAWKCAEAKTSHSRFGNDSP